VLVDGAVWLARSLTYQFALLEHRVGGASAGINTKPDAAPDALAAFGAELADEVAAGRLALHPGKGIPAGGLSALHDVYTGRASVIWTELPAATAHSAVTAAGVARSLDGASVAVEQLDDLGLAVARAAIAAGARVVAVSGGGGTASSADGFGLDDLAAAHAAGSVATLTAEPGQPWALFGAEAEVLFIGSKAGALDHQGAANVRASLVVPTGPVPVTAKAFAALRRNDVTVLPDFLTTAGIAFSHLAGPGQSLADVAAAVDAAVVPLTTELLAAPDGPLLGGCAQAEAFLATWVDDLPFGRPLA
jgi:glutamate dehydrogenase/leucine dehydrogenase